MVILFHPFNQGKSDQFSILKISKNTKLETEMKKKFI